MSDILEINASPRSDLGKAAMRRLRRTDKVPGIIYGDGKQPVLFTMAHNELAHSLENEAFAASVLKVNLGGSTEQVVIKDLQRHPFKPRLMHLDLLRVSGTTQLSMTVPLHFINEDIAPGVKLSGGQRQRIAIARALLMNPRILILDDSTSSVDFETEQRIQQALDKLMEGRTSFVIAQRIATVLNADQILVLDKGRIVARGTHEELIETSPIYAEIYHSQLHGEREI